MPTVAIVMRAGFIVYLPLDGICRVSGTLMRGLGQRDEVAPFHCSMSPVLSTERIAHVGTVGDCCVAGVQSARCPLWVRSGGPKQAAVSFDVRFTPKSGHPSDHSLRQLFAKAVIAASRVGA
jgi:hypothetical protein